MANIDAMTDEEELHKLLSATENFDQRKKIRARLKQIREEKSAEWEKARAERDACHIDVVALRQKQAKEQKERNIQQLEAKAKEKREKTGPSLREEGIRQRQETAAKEKQAQIESLKERGRMMGDFYGTGFDRGVKESIKSSDALKDKKMERYSEEAKSTSTKTVTGKDGVKTTTTTTTTKTAGDDGSTVTKQTKTISSVGGLGGTTFFINRSPAGETARRIAHVFNTHCRPETNGLVSVRTESWSSRDGATIQDEGSKSWGGAESAKNAFKQLDSQSGGGLNPEGSPVSVQRSPSTIKQMLLEWCKKMTAGYEHVNVTNFSGSWNDGMAFCALIHHFYPRAFNYAKLNPKCRRGNFKLAFEVSEKLGGIAPLLDVEDMVHMKNPDWKCVFTYVQQFYSRFRNWDAEQAEKAALEAAANAATKADSVAAAQ